jgi:hypothetical protein
MDWYLLPSSDPVEYKASYKYIFKPRGALQEEMIEIPEQKEWQTWKNEGLLFYDFGLNSIPLRIYGLNKPGLLTRRSILITRWESSP